ncbi:MAG: hypothetical protein E7318_12995 [Clostridiales bacterium]|nr:hypothetical protein [Clostridiales bacterium]
MGHADIWVDDAAHLLHISGHIFPCDREIVTALPWKNHALLLSADTDCLSLWDAEGIVRTARVGVYPQNMAVQGDTAYVCGGADGMLHLLSLPDLRKAAVYPLPGIVERVCTHAAEPWVLTLLPEPEMCTALLRIDLCTAESIEITRFSGIPGALATDDVGLWIGVTDLALHLPWATLVPDVIVDGIGLPERFNVQPEGVIITDGLEGQQIFVRT